MAKNMMQKNAFPKRWQRTTMQKNGLDPNEWVVVREMNHTMIVRNRASGEYLNIEK